MALIGIVEINAIIKKKRIAITPIMEVLSMCQHQQPCLMNDMAYSIHVHVLSMSKIAC